jgi:hypothetical protein
MAKQGFSVPTYANTLNNGALAAMTKVFSRSRLISYCLARLHSLS